MKDDQRDSLLDQDWSSAWASLPEAPELVGRPKTAQITLRIPATVVSRIKRVAHARALPYHTLARSWILEGLRTVPTVTPATRFDEPQDEQLNLKLDQEALDGLKAQSDQLRRPYHRLAREWIEASLVQEEKSLGLDPAPAPPAIKDLIVLLLHATNKQGDSAIRGMTRLQKLLFIIEQKLSSQSRFYAFNYGPFNEEVNDAAHALRLAGFLSGRSPSPVGPPSFAEMMATVTERSGPRASTGTDVEEFALNPRGHEAAERLRRSSRAYDQLYTYIRAVREEWDTGTLDELVGRVYAAYPKFAERSLIREDVTRRGPKRREP